MPPSPRMVAYAVPGHPHQQQRVVNLLLSTNPFISEDKFARHNLQHLRMFPTPLRSVSSPLSYPEEVAAPYSLGEVLERVEYRWLDYMITFSAVIIFHHLQ